MEESNFGSIEKSILEVKKDVQNLKVDEVLETNKKIVVKLDAVGSMAVAFQEGLTKLDDIFKEVADNSAKSADALEAMNKHMVTIVEKMSAPGPGIQHPTKAANDGENVDAVDNNKTTKSKAGSGARIAKMFSSSIALACNEAELESGLNCTLDVVETFHITKHSESQDPELYLRNMIDIHLKDDTDTDLVIFAVGSNDISKLNTENEDIGTLSTKACEQSSELVELAKYAVEKYEVEVFIVERPPRYDKEKNDPNGFKQLLSQSANGFLMSLITPLKNVHLIKLPVLDNLTAKARRGVFQHDGIHLTRHGASILADVISSGIRKVYKDIPVPVNIPIKSQFSTPPPRVPNNPDQHSHGPPQYGRHGRPGHPGQHASPQQPQYGHPGWRGNNGPGYRGRNNHNQNRNNRGRQEDGMPQIVREYLMGFNNGRYNGY